MVLIKVEKSILTVKIDNGDRKNDSRRLFKFLC